MTSLSDTAHAEILHALREAVSEAGKLALSKFRNNVRTWNKENASPVTEADLAVDNFLRERLTGLDPAIGWLSEETVDVPERLTKERLWIVDPIDGTRSFVAGREDWAICAALVERGRPVAGCSCSSTKSAKKAANAAFHAGRSSADEASSSAG